MIKNTIKNRRAVFPRQYNTKPLAKKDIEVILEAANWAPTHKRTEPWRFKVMQGEKLEEFGQFLAEQYKATAKKYSARKADKIKDKFQRSACVIAICMQRDPKERIPKWEEIAATAMAVQNMWLTAADRGIGAYWSTTSLRKETGKYFDFKPGETCLGLFYMGHFDGELPEGRRQPWTEKVEWI